MNGGEHITLQFGPFSNLVSSHFWNIEINECKYEQGIKNVLLKDIKSSNSVGVCPRNLVFDLRGNFGALPIDGEENVDETPVWTETLEIINRSEQIRDRSLNDISGDINWTEFAQFQNHPRSLCPLPIWRDDSAATNLITGHTHHNFQDYLSGQDRSLISPGTRETYFDEFRRLLEECDRIEQINVLEDVQSGFGGFASDFLATIREELPRINIPVWAFLDPLTSPSQALCSSHHQALALSYSDLLSDVASVVIPIDPVFAAQRLSFVPSLQETPMGNPYHLSAYLALLLNSVLKTQSKSSTDTARDWVTAASCNGKYRLCSMESVCPLPSHIALDPKSIFETFLTDFQPVNHPLFSSQTPRPVLPALNPFTTSLSASSNPAYNDISLLPMSHVSRTASQWSWSRRSRAYSNTVFLRGRFQDTFSQQLFEQCIGTKYLVTQSYEHRSSIHLPERFPIMRGSTPLNESMVTRNLVVNRGSRNDFWNEDTSVSSSVSSPGLGYHFYSDGDSDSSSIQALTSIGCDVVVGSHIDSIAKHFDDSTKMRSYMRSLERYGMDSQQIAEIQEGLRGLASLYLDSE